jgi:uncharacterized YccA/Bax inhibitor family protein
MAKLFRTSNPALNEDAFQREGIGGEVMTVNGTVNKTGVLLLCTVASAAWVWNVTSRSPEQAGTFAALGAIGGLVVAIVTIFKKSFAPITAPIYALLEGLLLGSISQLFEKQYPGIAIGAVSLTFGTLLAMLLAYRIGLVRATEKFTLGVVAATGGIALFYVLTLVLGFFGIQFNSIYGAGTIGIAFSVFVVIIAALNLVLDFNLIESGAAAGAPKYMEWYGGFSLLITLVWLYLEILRLLAKVRSRR